MDGLITGTVFVTVMLLFIKIGEMIDRWFTRRSQSPIPQPIPTKIGMVPLPPLGVTSEEMRRALVELGRAMNLSPIDTTLKGRAKPLFLTDQEWMDQTIERSLSNLESETHVDEDWYIKTEEEFEASSKKVQEETINSPIIL